MYILIIGDHRIVLLLFTIIYIVHLELSMYIICLSDVKMLYIHSVNPGFKYSIIKEGTAWLIVGNIFVCDISHCSLLKGSIQFLIVNQ